MSVLCGFGLLGYVMRKNRHPLAPVIPGGRIEEALPQSIIISQGDPAALLMRPIVISFFSWRWVSYCCHICSGGAPEPNCLSSSRETNRSRRFPLLRHLKSIPNECLLVVSFVSP